MAKNEKRSRRATNLYLPSKLVVWATEHAAMKHGTSLSKFIERQLMRRMNEVARATK